MKKVGAGRVSNEEWTSFYFDLIWQFLVEDVTNSYYNFGILLNFEENDGSY